VSYFVIATGRTVPVDDVAGVILVPADRAQAYVSDVAASVFREPERSRTFLIDDGTQTTDDLVSEAGDALFGGAELSATRLGQVLQRLLDAGCTVRIWWASGPGAHERIDVFREREAFVRELVERLSCGRDVNLLYQPGGGPPGAV
jgi:hypothetical protein